MANITHFDLLTREIDIKGLSQVIIVMTDNNSSKIKFIYDVTDDFSDVATKINNGTYNVWVKFLSPSDYMSKTLISDITYTEGSLSFVWNIPKEALVEKGSLQFAIEILGTDFRLSTKASNIYIYETVNKDDVTMTPAEEAWMIQYDEKFLGYISQMDGKFDTAINTATEKASQASQSATAASAAATSASNAAYSAQAAANSAASLVVNDLTTGGTTNALSAEQGKTLNASISKLDTLTANYNKRLSSIDPFAIFGASWDKSSNPTLTRTDVTNVFVSNVGVDSNVVVNDFDKALIWGEMKQVTDSLGNTFIRIPKCYIKKTDTTNLKTWQVSKTKYKDFYLPKCFWDFTNSRELDYVDVGAYNASSADGIKLDSKTGTYPLINKTIVQLRTMAKANGAGYQQLDIHVVDLLQTLFIIEQGTIQSQSKVAGFTAGQFTATHLATATETAANRIIVATATAELYEVGQTISIGTSQSASNIFYGRTITGKTVIDASNTAIEFDGTAVDIAVGNMLYNTGAKSGFSANIAASVGSPVSNSSGKFPFAWHGIENLFGSIYQFVDGVNINNSQAWVCPDAASYASNLFTAPYEKLNYVNCTADGYIKEMGYDPAHPYASFPATVGGSLSTYYGDYCYQSTGQRIALSGGRWSTGTLAGLLFWDFASLSSNASPALGGRLIKKPL